jgi:hypothetical protein
MEDYFLIYSLNKFRSGGLPAVIRFRVTLQQNPPGLRPMEDYFLIYSLNKFRSY